MTHITLLINNSESRKRHAYTSFAISLCRGSSVKECIINDSLSIDKESCVKDSTFEGNNGIGCYSFISNSVIGRYTTIGSRVSIGPFNHPTTWLSISEFQYRDTNYCFNQSLSKPVILSRKHFKRTIIGSDVWICDNVVITRSVNIGHGAVIGAGSVVTKDVPPYSIVAGNPARLIRTRFDQNVISELISVKWWELSISELDKLNLDFTDVIQCIAKIRNYRNGL
jgi:acetyltransferase-like isoleucine patch superfamily enzyme